MSTCLMKISHKTPNCNSSDGLQVFLNSDGTTTGFCFSCGTYVSNPLGDNPPSPEELMKLVPIKKSQEEIAEELAFVSKLPTVDIEARRLRKSALEYYEITVGFDERDGTTPRYVYFPKTKKGELVDFKVRLLDEKKMWSIASSKDVDLFGWKQAMQSGAKRLIITEGEYDAVALKRIFDLYQNEKFKDYAPAIVSVNNGVGGAKKEIARNIDEIRKFFKYISLCFDQDDPGKEAAEELCKLYPDFESITLPGKDANECLLNGTAKAAFQAAQFNSSKPKNSKLVWGRDLHEAAKKPAEWGFSWPWDHVNQATKGIRLGETIYIGAGQKQGKSEIVNHLAEHFIMEHGWKVLLVKPEEANNKTYKMVAGKIAAKKFHDPEVPWDEEAYEKAGEHLKNNLAMINLYQHISYDILTRDIRDAAGEGVKAVFIDPITNLVNGLPVAEQNTELQRIAQGLSALALDLNIVIFIFCHLRNPDAGLPHERGGKVESNQFAGSRAMARSCNLMFGLEGNRDPEISEQERNTKILVLLEDREFGNAGRYKLYWDKNTTLFNEVRE